MNVLVNEHSIQSQAVHGRPLVRIVIVGHVDHGKSTLIGRLLHETGSLPDGKLESLKAVSTRRGMPFEWSFLLDALQTERDQGITLDTSQIRFRTSSRDIVLIDAPGHAEFLRNMITGASQADAALLMIDAHEGVKEQTRRHGYLLHLLGVSQVAVVINKMDRVGFDENRFHEIESEIVKHLATLGLSATAVIPISARNGDGVASRTPSIAWHSGPTVLEVLDRFLPARAPTEIALRIPVQAVYKFDDRRIVAGRIETGRVAIGDEIAIMPRGTVARVQTIEAWPVPDESRVPREAAAGQSIGITLDREVFVDRGDILSAAEAPVNAARQIRARVFWLHDSPLAIGDTVTVRIGMAETRGTIALIDGAVNPGDLSAREADFIEQNNVGEIEIALSRPVAADVYALNPKTGRIVLETGGRIAGGGLILSIDSVGTRRENSNFKNRTANSRTKQIDLTASAGELSRLLANLTPAERLARFRREVAGKIILTTSFGLEDQVITHLVSKHGIEIEFATLDTGRLFAETYELWAETERRYGRRVRAVYPQTTALEALVDKHGINGFYESREARTACCYVRKVEPLNRALAGASGWIAGLRADQSDHRQSLDLVTVDNDRSLLKLNPLFDWTRDAVLAFAKANNVPINSLHAKGFASIGCAPCTRAIAPGELERAGRWWWEQEDKKECGLHISADGQVSRGIGVLSPT
jgi:sulfate adenylyltransferase large subunit/thioredoxin-dependent adenylylsulfate APS reductase